MFCTMSIECPSINLCLAPSVHLEVLIASANDKSNNKSIDDIEEQERILCLFFIT